MKQHLFLIVAILIIPSCNRTASRELSDGPANEQVATSPQVESGMKIDFDNLLGEINNCNEKELAYFNQH